VLSAAKVSAVIQAAIGIPVSCFVLAFMTVRGLTILVVFLMSATRFINQTITQEIFTNDQRSGTILVAVRQFWGRAAF
jgi:hypothetical protein